MHRTLIVLPDGTEIFSGAQGTAVMECTLTRWVNDGKELAPGAVCAQQAKITLLEAQPLQLLPGDPLKLYTVDEEETRQALGVFLIQKPQRTGAILRLTAYDPLQRLDRDLSSFLTDLEGWPYSLLQLAELVCEHCGLTLQNDEIPNGSFPVEKFSAEGVTGRMVMEWVAQASGCFCIADENGQPRLDWYTPAPVELATKTQHSVQLLFEDNGLTVDLADGETAFADGVLQLRSAYLSATGDGAVEVTAREILLADYCIGGGIRLEETTQPIEKVVLRQKDTDIGTAWPEKVDGCALCITGNPLLSAKNADTLKAVAQTLFSRFAGVRYTPGTLVTPNPSLRAGQTVTVTDNAGRKHTFYIMQQTCAVDGNTLVSTGSARRETVSAVENRSAKSLSGKLLSLRADVDGLAVENADNQGKLAQLQLDLEGIRGQVSAQEGLRSRVTTLEQRAEGLKLSVETLQTDGTNKIKTEMGYTFDDNGLRIARGGQQMENLLDNTGMYVKRNGQTILQANDKGVAATDVTVGTYLVVGNHARLENYTAGRTACFWLEG